MPQPVVVASVVVAFMVAVSTAAMGIMGNITGMVGVTLITGDTIIILASRIIGGLIAGKTKEGIISADRLRTGV